MHRYPAMGQRAGDGLPVVPVSFNTEICHTTEHIDGNIHSTLSRRYEPFTSRLHSGHDREISICGSAPSLRRHMASIRGDVFACNAAHDFLIANGIIPNYGMLWDADECIERMTTPHPEVEYLIASRCHPSVFDKFSGNKVVVWHAGGDLNLESALEERNVHEPIINGGSAAVVRAMFIAYAMGYRKMRLFGVDGSFENDETHIRKSLVEEPRMRIFCEHQWFDTAPWLAVQAEDFKLIGPALRDAGADITIFGEGLIPHIAKTLGFAVNPNSTT